MKADRELVSPEELGEWINNRLAEILKRELNDGENYPKVGIQKLKLESEGCNWTLSDYIRVGDYNASDCMSRLKNIVFEARQKFNLK
ncbi:hypothetical protein LLH00_03745 [bacterium]|nr:hypothetical protein [bacterium]